ncbi:MAG TPA: hypothetical protein VGG22_12380 [Candidatus Baltobacteraceae bacterium]|jgi:hypothetical protein
MLLDLLDSLAIGATLAAVIVGILTGVPMKNGARIGVAALIGAWAGFAAQATAAGWLARSAVLLVFFAVPFAVAVVFRTALKQLSPEMIIRLNAFRLLGGLILALGLTHRLAGPFPYSAGIGDVITGIAALSIARIAASESVSHWRVIAWNAFGLLDLVLAVFFALTSRPGSPLQLFDYGVGSTAITTLPWSMIPLVLVPIYMIGHALVFAHVRWAGAHRQGYAASTT